MGNKSKVVAIILGVVVFAAGIISGAFLAFKPRGLADTPVANAADYTVASNGTATTISGTSVNCAITKTVGVTAGHYYYVEIAGQDGGTSGQYNQCGYGFTGFGFLRASNSTYLAKIGYGGGSGAPNGSNPTGCSGGGYASFSAINFGLPTSNTMGTENFGVAAGGGGSTNGYLGSYRGGSGGLKTGFPIVDKNNYLLNGMKLVGTQNGNFGQNTDAFGNYLTGGKATYPGTGGGGAGYYGGAGNSYINGSAGGGFGGCSTMNLYPKYGTTIDTSTGAGYVKIIDLALSSENKPRGASVNYGATATTVAGRVTSGVEGVGFQYSTDNAKWSNTLPSTAATGTTTVYWRYVVNASKNYQYLSDDGRHLASGTQQVSTSNISNYVIDSGVVTLTVSNAPGTVSAPTLTGNGSATYSGNDIQVVTAAGQSSGTFTFATVKTKDEE